MKLTIKGQITIPKEIRKQFGLHPGMEVDVMENNGEMVIKKSGRAVDKVMGILKGKTQWKTTDEFIELVRGR